MPVELIAKELGPFAAAFEERKRTGPGWLDKLRTGAFERFTALGFPNSHDEDWKFTNLASLIRTQFAAAEEGDSELAAAMLTAIPETGPRIVFVNGRHVRGSNLLAASTETLERHLARYADARHQPFVALNTAFLEDGALVHVPTGTASPEPIQIVHVFLGGAAAQVAHPRTLIVVDAGAQVSVIETYVGVGTYLHNAVTEIVVGEDAVVEHVKLQRESASAFHISAIHVEQNRGSVFRSRSFALGAALARTEIRAVLDQGSECTLNGLYVVKDRQHVDTRTTIDHAKPHAASHELYKGILDGHASAVFNGKILVRKDAQKTDAKQTNKNLVLSEDASINTKPQLEILADDVRCTHGATVGQLDPDSLFYLRSRGIGAEDARKMLIDAFAREVVDQIPCEPFREYVTGLL